MYREISTHECQYPFQSTVVGATKIKSLDSHSVTRSSVILLEFRTGISLPLYMYLAVAGLMGDHRAPLNSHTKLVYRINYDT